MREKLKAFLVRRYSMRLHMSLILASCGLVAMSTSWSLLHFGVRSMLLRYPVAMIMAYATFLIGVWVWLRATGLAGDGARRDPGSARKAKSSGSDWIGDISTGSSRGSSGGGGGGAGIARGGGGSFDGGGASASFAEGRAPLMAAGMQQQSAADAAVARSGTSSTSSSKSGGGGLSIDIDGDGLALLVLAGVLIAAVFATSGYLIWCAPDVLTEAAFGAALTGTLSRPAAAHSASGWVAGVVRKTWWPFAVVLVAAMAFAGWSGAHYPQASTFREAVVMAIHNQH